jgi:hypothetical protein
MKVYLKNGVISSRGLISNSNPFPVGEKKASIVIHHTGLKG